MTDVARYEWNTDELAAIQLACEAHTCFAIALREYRQLSGNSSLTVCAFDLVSYLKTTQGELSTLGRAIARGDTTAVLPRHM